jgi:hypothetical protein
VKAEDQKVAEVAPPRVEVTTQVPDSEEFTTEYDNDYDESEDGIDPNAIKSLLG